MSIVQRMKEQPMFRNLLIFLSVVGPGIITGSVDNDAGGITTYSIAGALYGPVSSSLKTWCWLGPFDLPMPPRLLDHKAVLCGLVWRCL